jgi:hypothetical protein
MAWTTAMSELDPLAIIGPQGVKALAQRLTRSGGWLQLALRLGNKSCYVPDCSALGLHFDSTRCCRACQQHAQAGSPVLINDFIFERAPWRTVSTGAELQNALEDCPVGACIRVTGHIQFPDDADPVIIRCRLAGPLCVLSCSVFPINAILQDLELTTGSEFLMWQGFMREDSCHPALVPQASTLLRNCHARAYTVSSYTH